MIQMRNAEREARNKGHAPEFRIPHSAFRTAAKQRTTKHG